jgi:hypothetical protein
MFNDYIVCLGEKNVKCRYHETGDCYMPDKNKPDLKFKCTGIMCYKHSYIKRSEYAKKINNVLPEYKHRWFVTLTIGRIISQPEFNSLWQSFRHALSYRYPALEYIFIKEIQHNILHMHGIIVSNEHADISQTLKIWRKYLKKCCNITRNENEDDIGILHNEAGAAKYLMKDIKNPLGVQMPPKGWTKRLVLPSNGFWKPQQAIQSV